MTRFGFEFIII